jgi:hypothetical protein
MPGRLQFYTTADGAAVVTERMRIDSSGRVLIATTTQNFSRLNFPQDQYIGFQSGNFTVGGLRFEDNGGNGSAEIRFQGVGSNQRAEIVFYTGDTNGGENMSERVRITNNGITFNGDTAAANALDDYEEGTWTPTLINATGGDTATYSTQVGKYVKVGELVYCEFRIAITAKGGGSGQIRIGGLPFNCSSVSDFTSACADIFFDNTATSYVNFKVGARANNAQLYVYGQTAATTDVIREGNFSSGNINSNLDLRGGFTYRSTV